MSHDNGAGAGTAAERTIRVLIVDDDGDGTTALASLLGLLGYDVRTAGDGLRGLDSAERLRPQCIVLDIDLPGLDGLDIARRLRRAPWGRETLLIATTGWSRDEDRSAAMVAGFDHFLPKPLDLDALVALLPRVQPCVSSG
jgi:CheY-like chemotaxis protein